MLWQIALTAGCYLLVRTALGTGIDGDEIFSENLLVKPLRDGKTLLHFEFEIKQTSTIGIQASQHHYHLFPRQIGEIALQNNVEELYLSFTQGNWRQDAWGYPPTSSQGVGAEIIARINGTEQASLGKWKGLTNALSGVFCASLNFISDENTSKPRLMFNVSASNSGDINVPAHHGTLRHGFLPRESVCTENLTPWIKQLPCQAKSGLGALLNPYRLYNMHFHSMGISLGPVMDAIGDEQEGLVYKQHITVVLDPRTFGLDKSWALGELMERDVEAACPVSSKSTVQVVLPEAGVQVFPEPARRETLVGQNTYVYDIQKQDAASIRFEFSTTDEKETQAQLLPVVTAHRHVNGHGGGSSGGVETEIINRSNKPMGITYFDSLPWYLRVYLHTLAIEATDSDGRITKLRPTNTMFTPAIDRGRPSSIELTMTLPANTRTALRYSFDKGFIKYSEHPPDANRGFNIGPAIISYRSNADVNRPLVCALQNTWSRQQSECVVRVYTELFLASLPTPDFSMPYNVITFTCTILALFFGRIFNLLTRDFAVLKDSD
ncbi:Subunit of the glycosylphosphatidylinositol transamidase complex-like protein [Coemansia sp. RSA 1813]|nr:Subunit of the glycosylphosphatidylinositol transamidase complex-like protein [Coemansia sp. RSA 1843]KAJ2214913.1 Subunit of the glycosylphosphatidylinositol transamidase complex-like protein [Coemansia sp. RSA 487]KAJ2562378.1 Subunit of the glycosylphosphatidylinositol transamidase complex-like protein [Coemansia sp. RSA 1813]